MISKISNDQHYLNLSPDFVRKYQYLVDGRVPIEELYKSYDGLLIDNIFIKELVSIQEVTVGENDFLRLPIYSYSTPVTSSLNKEKKSILILSGVHGEEPSGPIAISKSIDVVLSLAKVGHNVVVFPLLNPAGYFRDWRYENVREYGEDIEGQSVTDSEHLLLNEIKSASRKSNVGQTATQITQEILKLVEQYHFDISIDLHEDRFLTEGAYVYSQGAEAEKDGVVQKILFDIQSTGIPIHPDGVTRFQDETIRSGIVVDHRSSSVGDGSIDELLSVKEYYSEGRIHLKHVVPHVFVTELPTQGKWGDLELRVKVYGTVLSKLASYVANI